MSAGAIGKKAYSLINGIANYAVLMTILLLVAFTVYALWDSNQLHHAADKSNYAIYKPTAENQGASFKELQAANPEVFAWLSVYGTNIDYPVAQGQDNMKYVNINAEGQFSMSGAIFLNCFNSRDFSDFNSILYGHHMANRVMFGKIEYFDDGEVFFSHRYGNLYYDGADHGLEFFAFIHADAYDSTVFSPNVQGGERQAYLDGIIARAEHIRDIGVTVDDRIILLSTCSSCSTNGRDILIGRITSEVFEEVSDSPAPGSWPGQAVTGGRHGYVEAAPVWLLFPAILLFVRLISYISSSNRMGRHTYGQKRRWGYVWDSQG